MIRSLFHYSAKHLQIEHAFMIKNPHVPKALYKHREFRDSHLTALTKNILWSSIPANFNDPYDTNVFFDSGRFFIENRSVEDTIAFAKELSKKPHPRKPSPLKSPILSQIFWEKAFGEFASAVPDDAERLNEFFEFLEEYNKRQNENMIMKLSENLQNGFRVLSLSELCTSILMWSHYSDAHRGFCIEYDFSSLPYEDLRRRLCFPVYYRRKLTDATRYLARTDMVNFNNLFGQYLCLLKSDEWAYEREWRIVYPTGNLQTHDKVVMPTPSSIILGVRVSAENKEWMSNFCKRNDISLLQVQQRRDVFRLKVVPCNI